MWMSWKSFSSSLTISIQVWFLDSVARTLIKIVPTTFWNIKWLSSVSNFHWNNSKRFEGLFNRSFCTNSLTLRTFLIEPQVSDSYQKYWPPRVKLAWGTLSAERSNHLGIQAVNSNCPPPPTSCRQIVECATKSILIKSALLKLNLLLGSWWGGEEDDRPFFLASTLRFWGKTRVLGSLGKANLEGAQNATGPVHLRHLSTKCGFVFPRGFRWKTAKITGCGLG